MKLQFEGPAARMANSSLATVFYTVCGKILEILTANTQQIGFDGFAIVICISG